MIKKIGMLIMMKLLLLVSIFAQKNENETIFIGTVKSIKPVKEMGLMYRVCFEIDSIIKDDYIEFKTMNTKKTLKSSFLTQYHFCDPKDPFWESGGGVPYQDCGFSFSLGKKYLVYVTYYHHGSLAISGLSKTKELFE